jgi:hypothetical protein
MPGGMWQVDMGPARLGWRDVPLAREMDTLHVPLACGPVADPAAPCEFFRARSGCATDQRNRPTAGT